MNSLHNLKLKLSKKTVLMLTLNFLQKSLHFSSKTLNKGAESIPFLLGNSIYKKKERQILKKILYLKSTFREKVFCYRLGSIFAHTRSK